MSNRIVETKVIGFKIEEIEKMILSSDKITNETKAVGQRMVWGVDENGNVLHVNVFVDLTD